MSTTSVYSIRIDPRVRKMIDEVTDPAFQDELRTLIERAARQKLKAEILMRARKAHRTVSEGTPAAAEIIREDRDAR